MKSIRTFKKIIPMAAALLMSASWNANAWAADGAVSYTQVDASAVKNGLEFVMVADTTVALTVAEDRAYGYLYVEPVETDNAGILVPEGMTACNFTLESAPDGGYYIKDCYDRYLYLKGTYNSFNLDLTLPDEGAEWSIEILDDGVAKIVNKYSNKYIQYHPSYVSYGAYDDERGILPKLYAKSTSTTVPVEYEKLTSLGEAIEKAELLENRAFSDPYIVDFEPVVTYVLGAFNYITDGNKYFLIYKDGLGLEAGQKINKGWTGRLHNYFGLLEFQPEEDTKISAEPTGSVPAPVRIESASEITKDLLCAVVYIPNVVFDAEVPGTKTAYSGKICGQEMTFYNNHTVPGNPAGTYDVLGVIGAYYDQLQVEPLEFTLPSSVDEINPEESAEYFDLHGVRIKSPQKGGIYILRSGQTTKKVIVSK